MKAKKIVKSILIGEDGLQIQEVKFRKPNGWNWRIGKMRFEKAITFNDMYGLQILKIKKYIGWNKTKFFS